MAASNGSSTVSTWISGLDVWNVRQLRRDSLLVCFEHLSRLDLLDASCTLKRRWGRDFILVARRDDEYRLDHIISIREKTLWSTQSNNVIYQAVSSTCKLTMACSCNRYYECFVTHHWRVHDLRQWVRLYL